MGEDTVDPALQERVKDALEGGFDWQELEEGLNDIYRLDGDDNTYLCKVHTTEDVDLERFRAEPLLYSLVKRTTDVPTPDVVHTSFGDEQAPFYIMEYIDGSNPYEHRDELGQETLGSLLEQYGRMLGAIHSNTGFDRHGVLVGREGELGFTDGTDSWQDSLRLKIDHMEELIQERYEDPPVLYLEETRPRLEEVLDDGHEPVLLHQDNRLENLLTRDGEIVGFLDWSHVRAGHSEYDLARAEYLLLDWDLNDRATDELRERLFDGYLQSAALERDDGYRERRQFYRYVTVLWLVAGFPNWGSDWSEERQQQVEQGLKERLAREKPV